MTCFPEMKWERKLTLPVCPGGLPARSFRAYALAVSAASCSRAFLPSPKNSKPERALEL